MITIECKNLPKVRVFINNELFVDQQLPYKKTKLVPVVQGNINKILVKNMCSDQIVANGQVIGPNNYTELRRKASWMGQSKSNSKLRR
tara:strand:+ start:775 stop:1038 length:264 start_codon:yes stop_codon:yes gene_type:complete